MPTAADKRLAASFMEKVPLTDVLPINRNMHSATEHTMISIMGSPRIPLTTKCQNARASDIVKDLAVTETITEIFSADGNQAGPGQRQSRPQRCVPGRLPISKRS